MNSAHATPAYKKKSKVYKTRIYNQIQSLFQDVLSYVQFPLKISVDLREEIQLKAELLIYHYCEMFQGLVSISLVLWLLHLRNLITSSICQISEL